jgi:hypothetical protein
MHAQNAMMDDVLPCFVALNFIRANCTRYPWSPLQIFVLVLIRVYPDGSFLLLKIVSHLGKGHMSEEPLLDHGMYNVPRRL